MQVNVYVPINNTVNGNKTRVKVCIDGDEIKVFNVWGKPLVSHHKVGTINQTCSVECSGFTMRHYMQEHEEHTPGYIAECLQWCNFRELLEAALISLLKGIEHETNMD